MSPTPSDDSDTLAAAPTPEIHAWTICAWPPALSQASALQDLPLVHLGTHVFTLADEAGQASGQTLWGDARAEPTLGIAWDWVRIRPGVVAIADPLGLLSNLRLLDADGVAISAPLLVLKLNCVVHALPWQPTVLDALAALETARDD